MNDEHRTALVTGANRGIGLEVCRQLAEAGMRVLLGAREVAKGNKAAATLGSEGLEVRAVQLDVSDPASIEALARDLAGCVGVLVNSVCPGWVATDMGGRGGRPVRDGAASVVWAALLPDGTQNGGFFRDGKPVPW